MKPQGSVGGNLWERLAYSLRIPTLVLFIAGCFGVLLFLWVAFGGATPMKAQRYEVRVDFKDAATLAEQSDVRIAGVSVGKVTKKELNKDAGATRAWLSIDKEYAPLPVDTKAILRQKTLIGETFVELAPGSPSAEKM